MKIPKTLKTVTAILAAALCFELCATIFNPYIQAHTMSICDCPCGSNCECGPNCSCPR